MLFGNRTKSNPILVIVGFHSLLQIKSYSGNYRRTRSKVSPCLALQKKERLKKKKKKKKLRRLLELATPLNSFRSSSSATMTTSMEAEEI